MLRKDYSADLNRAIELTLKRDYGQALYLALRTLQWSSVLDPDIKEREHASLLAKNLLDFIIIEFVEQNRRKGRQLSEWGIWDLIRRESRHWKRFDSYMHPGGMERYDFRYVTVPLTVSPN